MSNCNEAVKNELEELLKSCGFKEDDAFDFSEYSAPVLKKDYDGTPIVGQVVVKARRGRPRSANKTEKKEGKKDGRGRPQNKTITLANFDTKEKKFAIVAYLLAEKYSEEFINYMYDNKMMETIYIPSDGFSDCERIRLYIGTINEKADGRDKAKGRYNMYERKGVFPLKDTYECLQQFHIEWELNKK